MPLSKKQLSHKLISLGADMTRLEVTLKDNEGQSSQLYGVCSGFMDALKAVSQQGGLTNKHLTELKKHFSQLKTLIKPKKSDIFSSEKYDKLKTELQALSQRDEYQKFKTELQELPTPETLLARLEILHQAFIRYRASCDTMLALEEKIKEFEEQALKSKEENKLEKEKAKLMAVYEKLPEQSSSLLKSATALVSKTETVTKALQTCQAAGLEPNSNSLQSLRETHRHLQNAMTHIEGCLTVNPLNLDEATPQSALYFSGEAAALNVTSADSKILSEADETKAAEIKASKPKA